MIERQVKIVISIEKVTVHNRLVTSPDGKYIFKKKIQSANLICPKVFSSEMRVLTICVTAPIRLFMRNTVAPAPQGKNPLFEQKIALFLICSAGCECGSLVGG